MRYGLQIFVVTVAFAVTASLSTRAQDVTPPAAPEPNAVAGNARVDACASDPSRLGLSRVVEIDTADGPPFGGEKGQANDFLKDGEIVLTFDDGPLKHYTRAVLKALADHCTKATFFMVGRMAASDPAMVKEVANAGHTVATHTWSHKNLTTNSFNRSKQEFELGFSAVNRALGAPVTPFFRFPYLGDNHQVSSYLKSRNVSPWWIDVDSKDYTSRDPAAMQRRVMAGLAAKGKGVILMHDIQPSTANGIKGLLDELHAKGFKVVHIVAKAPSNTVAEYDSAVEKLFKSKTAAVAANPLADRSLVWTMPSAKEKPGPIVEPAATALPAKPKGSNDLPWLDVNSSANNGQAPAVKNLPKPKQTPPAVEILPWKPSTFGY